MAKDQQQAADRATVNANEIRTLKAHICKLEQALELQMARANHFKLSLQKLIDKSNKSLKEDKEFLND